MKFNLKYFDHSSTPLVICVPAHSPQNQTLMFTAKGSKTANTMTKAAMAEVFEAIDAIAAITVTSGGKTYAYTDLCVKVKSGCG